MSFFWKEGTWHWLRDKEFDWIPVQVVSVSRGSIRFTSPFRPTPSGDDLMFHQQDLTHEVTYPISENVLEGLDDMSSISDLHESAILRNLELRYRRSVIYTSIGSILCAVNPYQLIQGVYGTEKMTNYKGTRLGEKPPHIYALANEAYMALWRMNRNQCLLISGESGAGKTESTKFILSFLTFLSQGASTCGTSARVEAAIQQSSPVLEAFGNAKTIHNDNSSRFGKYIQLHFNPETGNMVGGLITEYLLEKNRVAKQNPGERNFHIFYEFLRGCDEEDRAQYSLGEADPGSFWYLSQGGNRATQVLGKDDANDFKEVIEGLKVIHVPKSEIQELLSVIAAILHLGNLKFLTSGGAQVSNPDTLAIIAGLLGVPEKDFSGALTHKFRLLRGEEISTPLTVSQAEDSRDSVAMALYSSVFRWINSRVNQRITKRQNQNKTLSIGVLDIFGFECFDQNHFEQFNINYANEKLQEYFNKHIFSLEQHEYSKEGIPWVDIEWQDNSECLDLIEQRLGVVSLMNEESTLPNGQDSTLAEKLHSSNEHNHFYIRPRLNLMQFGIRHYAGEVVYEILGMVEKNRDLFREDLLKLMKSSSSEFIYDRFSQYGADLRQGAGISKKRSFRQQVSRGVCSTRRTTVTTQFKDSLQALMGSLNAAHPYFVRCIKPNNQKLSERFEHRIVLNQLRYSGMMETVKIRRAGYPVRQDQRAFIERFFILAKVVTGVALKLPIQDPTDIIHQLLTEYDPANKQWQIGNSKVFLKEQLENKLEAERELAYKAYVNIIASYIYTFVLRKRFLKAREASIVIQKHLRRHIAMRRFREMRGAAVTLQTYARGFLARKQYRRLLAAKREEEERRRREEEEKELRRREELLRLEMENKKREAQLLKKQLEEGEARKVLARIEEERSTQEAIVKFHELQDRRKSRVDSSIQSDTFELPPPPIAELTPGMLAPEQMRARGDSPGYSELSLNSSLTEEELQRVEQEALTHILDLDACLKEEETRSDDYLSSTSSYEYDNEFEERERFAAIQRALGLPGSDLYSLSMDGFLYLRGGKANPWKRRWCVLRDQTFMYFKNKQDSLKQGWMYKRSYKRTTTMGKRAQMKRRFFVLRGSHLFYYESDEEDSKSLNTLDIRTCTTVSDEGTRNNLFSVTNADKTYLFSTDTQEEKREWMDLFRRIKYMNDKQMDLLQLSVEADPRNAMGSLDLDLIDDVSATKQSNRSNSFAIIMAHRVMILSADKPEEMHRWISALKPTHRSINTQGLEILHKGYLIKEQEGDTGILGTISRKKRFYVLTRDGLTYYRSEDSWLMGQIRLDSLCSLILPNEFTARENDRWTFMLNTRKKSYLLGCTTEQDYQEWVYTINNVIYNKQVIETPTEKLINFIVETRVPRRPHVLDEIYRVYSRILSHQSTPIKFPLLALPYGKPILLASKAREYETLHAEAINIFGTLLNHEVLADPIPVTQRVINTCYDVEDLRSEIYCQLIKQTSGVSLDSLPALRCWQFLCCLSWCFVPDRAILKYLKIHLNRTIEKNPETEIQKFAEFAMEGLNRVKPREFPPSKDEISALLGRRQMNVKVNCYSGGACDIQINSTTTAGEVVRRLCIGLGITKNNNKFALFEISRDISKFIEDKTIIADVLSKHERFIEYDIDNGAGQCHLFFRILCSINPSAVSFNTIEFALMIEQAHENVVRGFFPASQKSLIKLGALHLQFTQGDYTSGTVINDITKEYPLNKVKEDSREHKESASLFNKNTLKGLGKDTMKRLKDTNIDEMLANEMELQSVKGQVTDFWRKLRGMAEEVALEEHMNILREWPGFGSTFFNAQYTDIDDRLPRNLWLGLNVKGVQFYRRGDTKPLAEHSYDMIDSYEAIGQNFIKLHFSDETQAIRLETSKVLEICKILNAFTAFTNANNQISA